MTTADSLKAAFERRAAKRRAHAQADADAQSARRAATLRLRRETFEARA